MVLGQQPLLPFFSIEQEQDQCWLYWGSLTGLYLSPGGLRAVWALSWGPTTQVPVTSANVDPKLCCGLWPILSGLRPDHLTDSFEQHWEGLSCQFSLVEPGSCVCAVPSCQLSQQTHQDPACGKTSLNAAGLFSRKQRKTLAERLTWEGSKWLHTEKPPWLSWLIYSNFSQL